MRLRNARQPKETLEPSFLRQPRSVRRSLTHKRIEQRTIPVIEALLARSPRREHRLDQALLLRSKGGLASKHHDMRCEVSLQIQLGGEQRAQRVGLSLLRDECWFPETPRE